MINDVIQSKDKCDDITIYDIIQAFDSLFLIDCLNDLYDTLPSSSRDDKFALIYDWLISLSSFPFVDWEILWSYKFVMLEHSMI